MKILTKNGLKFAIGMFWQIPDYGKKNVNINKVYKDTKNDMYCSISSLNSTYGFCTNSALHGEKNVAALAKFIVEAAKLSSAYHASIICYKFKSKGEVDEGGRELKEDLYGYLVLLNGTICPIDGEYVGEFEVVRNSIFEQAKLYPIDTLYLPLDVANKFLGVYERLVLAYHAEDSDSLLVTIIENLNKRDIQEILELLSSVKTPLLDLEDYLKRRLNYSVINLEEKQIYLKELKRLIGSEELRYKLRDNVQTENNIRYLVANILQVPLSSDAIFWEHKFKHNHNKSMLKNIKKKRLRLYFFGIMFLLILAGSYGAYVWREMDMLTQKSLLQKKSLEQSEQLMPAIYLINKCLGDGNDRFFGNLDKWNLESLHCDYKHALYTFKTLSNNTSTDLARIIKVKSGIKILGGNTATYNKPFPAVNYTPGQVANKNKLQLQLQEGSANFAYKIVWSQQINKENKLGFILNANVSPIFLLQHKILNDINLREINMKLDRATGIYKWELKGEI